MKFYSFLSLTLLFSGCEVQKPPQQSNAESNDLVYKQYLQFLNYMLFEIGDKNMAIENLFKSAEAGCGEAQIELGGCYAYSTRIDWARETEY